MCQHRNNPSKLILHFRLINHSRFRNPPSSRRAETNFRWSSSRSCAPHFYEVSCFRYDMVPDESSRAAYETRARGAICWHTLARTRKRAETVNPETRRGQCARLLSRGNELRSRTADVTCYGTGRTTRRNRSIEVRSIFFSLEQAGRTRVSFCDSSRSRDRNRHRYRDPSYRKTSRTAINQSGL